MEKWQPWQLQALGFLMPWWLLALPWIVGASLDASRLARPLREVPFFVPLLLGVVVAVFLRLCSKSSVARNLAAWFLLGLVCTPFAATLAILVARFFL